MSACGGDDSSKGVLDLTSDPADEVKEPKVSIPDALPTELVITDLTEGTGSAAVAGDTVFVHYVGVLSKDGTRFDGNFDAEPFPVTIGIGSVIPGWDQGLVGVKAGGRRQLDIPAELAYGDKGAGDSIGPNEALSFLIDTIAIVPAIDASLEPTGDIEARDPVDTVGISDVTEGTGTAAKDGDHIVVHIVAFRADTGARLDSTWVQTTPLDLTLTQGATLEGFVTGLVGMKVGGRRQLTVPYALAFGDEGNTSLGLPAKTDLVVIVDLFAIF